MLLKMSHILHKTFKVSVLIFDDFVLMEEVQKKTVQTKFALYKTQTSQLYKTIVPKYKTVGSNFNMVFYGLP